MRTARTTTIATRPQNASLAHVGIAAAEGRVPQHVGLVAPAHGMTTQIPAHRVQPAQTAGRAATVLALRPAVRLAIKCRLQTVKQKGRVRQAM